MQSSSVHTGQRCPRCSLGHAPATSKTETKSTKVEHIEAEKRRVAARGGGRNRDMVVPEHKLPVRTAMSPGDLMFSIVIIINYLYITNHNYHTLERC